MGQLFDFFADHPNVPKLFVRRLLEADASTSEIERDILIPAWRRFASWTYDYPGMRGDDVQAQLFMLTAQSVLLMFLLDSQQFVTLLGGSVLKGAGLSGLWSPAAFVIVILGTIAAILVQTPMPTFKRALAIVRWVFRRRCTTARR